MAFTPSSFKESVESYQKISCYVVRKENRFVLYLWCHYICRPTRCLSARFTTIPCLSRNCSNTILPRQQTWHIAQNGKSDNGTELI